MAGDWIKMDVGLPEKPEVWQIANMVGLDADTVVGKLLKVWRWFDAHTEDGNAHGVTYPLVDHVAGVTGFGEAMAMVCWLEQDGHVMRLPNFDRHNGKTAKNRALTAKRVAACKAKGNAEGNADIVTLPLPREEKRREEIKAEKASPSLSAAADSTPACPHTEIVALYHEILPANPKIKVWDGARAQALRARWREDAKRQSLDYWRRLFAHIAASPFLTGRVEGRNGRAFLPGLDWIVNPQNFAKIIEGRFHDRSAA